MKRMGKYIFIKTATLWSLLTDLYLLLVLSFFQAEVDMAATAIKKLGGKLMALDLVDSFSADGQRTAVVVRKVLYRIGEAIKS